MYLIWRKKIFWTFPKNGLNLLLLNKVLKLQKKRKYEISVGRSHFLTVTHLYFIVRNVMADILTFIQKTKILTGWGSKKHFRVKNSQFQLSKMRLFKINISQLFFNIQKPFCLRWKAICKIYNFYKKFFEHWGRLRLVPFS